MALPLIAGGAAAGLGTVGALSSFFGKKSQASEMRRQARERLRGEQATDNATLGKARVAAGASSGVAFESTSLQDWISAMDAEFTRTEQFTYRTGMKAAAATDRAAAWGLIGDLGSTFTSFASANNWFRSAPTTGLAPGLGGMTDRPGYSNVPSYLVR